MIRGGTKEGFNISCVHLERVLVREEVHDLKGRAHDAHSLKLLATVAAMHHQHESDTLHDGALRTLSS